MGYLLEADGTKLTGELVLPDGMGISMIYSGERDEDHRVTFHRKIYTLPRVYEKVTFHDEHNYTQYIRKILMYRVYSMQGHPYQSAIYGKHNSEAVYSMSISDRGMHEKDSFMKSAWENSFTSLTAALNVAFSPVVGRSDIYANANNYLNKFKARVGAFNFWVNHFKGKKQFILKRNGTKAEGWNFTTPAAIAFHDNGISVAGAMSVNLKPNQSQFFNLIAQTNPSWGSHGKIGIEVTVASDSSVLAELVIQQGTVNRNDNIAAWVSEMSYKLDPGAPLEIES